MKIKGLLVMLLLSLMTSHAQQEVLVLCSQHRNEVASLGLQVFTRNGLYCVALGDNSLEVIEQFGHDLATFLTNSWASIFSVKEDEIGKAQINDVTDGILEQERLLKEKEETFEEWQARMQWQQEQGMLDPNINLATGENTSDDEYRYAGSIDRVVSNEMSLEGIRHHQKSPIEEFLNSIDFWNLD